MSGLGLGLVCVFKYAFWGTHLMKLMTCQASEYIIDILFIGEDNDDPKNVWAWPRLACNRKYAFWGQVLMYSLNKTYNMSKANIINILFTSMNKNKLINFMNLISDKLHVWFTVSTSRNSFKNISGTVQIKNNCQLCIPKSSESPNRQKLDSQFFSIYLLNLYLSHYNFGGRVEM